MNLFPNKGFTLSNNSAKGKIPAKPPHQYIGVGARRDLTGFTLVEVIVSVCLFSIILMVILGFFGYAIKGQHKALASQEISDQIGYAIEHMSRSIRMAKKDRTGACVSTAGTSYENPYALPSIRFLNYEGLCLEFYVEDEKIKRKKSSDGTWNNFGPPVNLTSPKLKIDSAKFNIIGDVLGDSAQPKITIFLEAEKKDTKPELNAKVKIQTTISERNLDIN